VAGAPPIVRSDAYYAAMSREEAAARPTAGAVVRATLAAALVLATLAVLAVRVPDAVRALSGVARSQIGRDELDGGLAAADSLDVNDDFVRQTVALIPPHAWYAVLLPADPNAAQQSYGVSPVTLQGLPDFLREVLLPRRDVETQDRVNPPVPVGGYVICFYCDTSPWDQRTRWLWTSEGADIGRVYR
jgi:hypothetical protein